MESSPVPVYFARCDSYEPAALREALKAVLEPQFASAGPLQGKRVLLKPNLLRFHRGGDQPDIASVHPAFLLETARLFQEAGTVVEIWENPGTQSAETVLEAMGIGDDLRQMGVKFETFRDFQAMQGVENTRFRSVEIAQEFRDFDFVADIAKYKTHGMMTLTLCVKNLFGMISGSARIGHHLSVGRNFAEFADFLLDLYLIVKPRFNLVDAVIGMEGNGPGSGDSVKLGFIAGAEDALALDAAAAEQCGVPDLLTVRRGKERGLFRPFAVHGERPERVSLQLPDPPGARGSWGLAMPGKEFLRKFLLAHPALDAKRCIRCNLCAKMCPPKAIAMTENGPRFDLDRCIRCFCCAEYCPKGALAVCGSPWMTLVRKVERFLQIFR